MEHLLNKLSNLSYDLLGIILPGSIALILFMLWLIGVGDLLPYASDGFFTRVTFSTAAKTLETIGVRTGVGIVGPILLAAYFAGHLLHWISRRGAADDSVVNSDWRRTWNALTFRVPKPTGSYDDKLEPLYQGMQQKFNLPTTAHWVQFYPIAKSYLSRNLSVSLVSVYQNKYTLHRSVAAAAALFFWLSVSAMSLGLLPYFVSDVHPRWVPLAFLGSGCLTLVWGFSASYAYHWKLFGNTIITESYSILSGPPDVEHR